MTRVALAGVRIASVALLAVVVASGAMAGSSRPAHAAKDQVSGALADGGTWELRSTSDNCALLMLSHGNSKTTFGPNCVSNGWTISTAESGTPVTAATPVVVFVLGPANADRVTIRLRRPGASRDRSVVLRGPELQGPGFSAFVRQLPHGTKVRLGVVPYVLHEPSSGTSTGVMT